jgi:hypothetical protein
MNHIALICVLLCCVTWMLRPGRRPQLFVVDILPWLCVAASIASDGMLDGALSAVLAWAAVPLVYLSIKYNRLAAQTDSPADGVHQAAC